MIYITRHLGAGIKWLFYGTRKPYKTLLKTRHNGKIGYLIYLLVVSLLIFLYFHDQNFSNLEKIPQEYSKDEEIKKVDDPFCDTNKFKNFKNNLIVQNFTNTEIVGRYHDDKANIFIKRRSKEDSLFRSKIHRNIIKEYKYNKEFKIYLFGYVLDQATNMESNSSSFFILTIYKNDKVLFSDIIEDLKGEIKADINGIENLDNQIIVWGSCYPYFGFNYGKFKLIINDGKGLYNYECHRKP